MNIFLMYSYHPNIFFTFYDTECQRYFKKSLFFVGEIGGNDLFSHISQNFSNFGILRNLVPLVVKEITKTVKVSYIFLYSL
jgi:hypothetical protein